MSGFEKRFVNRRKAGTYVRWVAMLAQAGQLPVTPQSRILELGAGNGLLSAVLEERFHPAAILVTDYDPAQVEVARQALGHRFGRLPATMLLERADASQLRYPDSSFDFVFAHMILHHVGRLEAIDRALDEALRVLRPGGRLVYADFRHKQALRAHLQSRGFEITRLPKGWSLLSRKETVVAKRR